ncbi:MAG: hypothetical protein AB7I04_03115 [Pseudomonadales bacterium]
MKQKLMRKMQKVTRSRVWSARALMAPALAMMLLLGTPGAVSATEDGVEEQPARTASDTAADEVASAGGVAAGASAAASPKKKRRASRKELDARLDTLLAQTLSADEYRETRDCLSRNAYRKIEVLNEEYVLFSKGEEHWINKLRRRCPSLKFNDLPVFVQRGTSSLCENDPFYPTNSMDLNVTLSGGPVMGYQGICYLGDFEQISAEQAALIRGT